MTRGIRRRELLRLAAAGGGLLLGGLAGCGASEEAKPGAEGASSRRTDFGPAADGDGWGADWACVGVATLQRQDGQGLLIAGSDIFPNDPRPVAFALDARFLEGSIRAVVTQAGRSAGVVLRRNSIRTWYAAIWDTDTHTLAIVRRIGADLVTLAQTLVLPTAVPDASRPASATLEFAVSGQSPSLLSARLTGADGLVYETAASDAAPELQQPGDAGVLARADTLLPDSNPVLPALGNLHLLPYSVQEGQAIIESPAGAALIDTIRRRSTVAFSLIEVTSVEPFELAAASVVAATSGAPLPGGARLHVATDLPAQVSIELSVSPDFAGSRIVEAGAVDATFLASAVDVDGLPPGDAYWRARVQRGSREAVGPARRFRVLPPPGDAASFTLAYGACAAQFNQVFDHLAARAPDVFVWQGDLNYPDTHGPFAQTVAGYAGIWRHFLDNPRLAPILARTCFVGGRDDHDYGLQDARAANIPPWGDAPWNALINPQPYQRIDAGLADIWILDQRLFKDDPLLPDDATKTLLGAAQRAWLLDGLAASDAPFHIVCSPCTLAPAPGANARDGSWATGFAAERELLLAHLRKNVRGQTVFLTGDTHFTMLWEKDGLFEQRACPLDIPTPNDQNISNPLLELSFGGTPGVAYWSRRGHFSFLTVGGVAGRPTLTVELVRDDGVSVMTRRFEAA